MVMERISNNEFNRKGMPERTQYLKDGDDDHEGKFNFMSKKLTAIIWLISVAIVLMSGYMFNQIFLV